MNEISEMGKSDGPLYRQHRLLVRWPLPTAGAFVIEDAAALAGSPPGGPAAVLTDPLPDGILWLI